ncbi:MAG: S-layer homology domain-containing protein [Clostridia bacterium]|nr:S-layer homology domain-containing protein [Clostridia bacterium]
MKKIIYILITAFIFSINVSAEEAVLDVFEEYASFEDTVCKTGAISVQCEKNKSVAARFRAECTGKYSIEIVKKPQMGEVEVVGEKFVYTPFRDRVGEDSFSYKIISGGISSNISTVSVFVSSNADTAPTTDFTYADTIGRECDYAVVKLLEMDIIKGERVGNEYYFYPDASVNRASALIYVNTAFDIEKTTVNENEVNIFDDCDFLSYPIRKNAYIAHKARIINGVQENGAMYLYPMQNVTKAEFICMLDRALGAKTNSDIELKFPDKTNIPDYAEICVKNLVSRGILTNSKNTPLEPDRELKKEEMALMLYKAVKFNEKKTVQTLSQRIKAEVYGSKIS